jgi:HKD family nuclease
VRLILTGEAAGCANRDGAHGRLLSGSSPLKVRLQSPSRPEVILDSLAGLADSKVTRIRIAAAYVTAPGCFALTERLKLLIPIWDHLPKVLITSFDFGITDPDALAFMENDHDFRLLVSSTNVDASGHAVLRTSSSFHPKLYIFDLDRERRSLIGSPNLTYRAMGVNTEIAEVADPSIDPVGLDNAWDELEAGSEVLSTSLLNDYRAKRSRIGPTFQADDPVDTPPSPSARSTDSFVDAVGHGAFSPQQLKGLWVEAGSMTSGGSRNQLELPRGAESFFGFQAPNYQSRGNQAQPLGTPPLSYGRLQFADRRVTWHADNMMLRINLPTAAKGGPSYQDTVVLFQVIDSGYEMKVAPEGSTRANAWKQAGHIFPLGALGQRHWGVF